MDCQRVIETLRVHEQELKGIGIVHLSLFGSVARGDARPDSDVDLMAEFDATKRLSLLAKIGIENRLSEILGAAVELSQRDLLKEPVRIEAEREAVLAF